MSGRLRGMTRHWIWLSLAMCIASGCDKTIDPAAGEANIRLTLPGSTAHGARLDQRWEQCVQNNPPSLCDRRFPGGRPFGHGSGSSDAPTADADAADTNQAGDSPSPDASTGR